MLTRNGHTPKSVFIWGDAGAKEHTPKINQRDTTPSVGPANGNNDIYWDSMAGMFSPPLNTLDRLKALATNPINSQSMRTYGKANKQTCKTQHKVWPLPTLPFAHEASTKHVLKAFNPHSTWKAQPSPAAKPTAQRNWKLVNDIPHNRSRHLCNSPSGAWGFPRQNLVGIAMEAMDRAALRRVEWSRGFCHREAAAWNASTLGVALRATLKPPKPTPRTAGYCPSSQKRGYGFLWWT